MQFVQFASQLNTGRTFFLTSVTRIAAETKGSQTYFDMY